MEMGKMGRVGYDMVWYDLGMAGYVFSHRSDSAPSHAPWALFKLLFSKAQLRLGSPLAQVLLYALLRPPLLLLLLSHSFPIIPHAPSPPLTFDL